MHYWLIKTLLILALIATTYFLVRPVQTDKSLAVRRIGMLLVIIAAIFAIIFPELFNQFARLVGVESGTNLLVYLLVVALFAQMVSGYRRDIAAEAKLTELARAIALAQTAEEIHRKRDDEISKKDH